MPITFDPYDLYDNNTSNAILVNGILKNLLNINHLLLKPGTYQIGDFFYVLPCYLLKRASESQTSQYCYEVLDQDPIEENAHFTRLTSLGTLRNGNNDRLLFTPANSNVPPRQVKFTYFRQDAWYDLALMSDLPENDKNKANDGIIYLSENGNYVVRDFKGVLQEGSLNIQANNIDLSKLQERLKDPTLKSAILAATSQADHTQNVPEEALEQILFNAIDAYAAQKSMAYLSPKAPMLITDKTHALLVTLR